MKIISEYNVGPPSDVSWFINPHNYSYLRTINHSYWSYKPTERYLGGPTLYVIIMSHPNQIGQPSSLVVSPRHCSRYSFVQRRDCHRGCPPDPKSVMVIWPKLGAMLNIWFDLHKTRKASIAIDSSKTSSCIKWYKIIKWYKMDIWMVVFECFWNKQNKDGNCWSPRSSLGLDHASLPCVLARNPVWIFQDFRQARLQ